MQKGEGNNIPHVFSLRSKMRRLIHIAIFISYEDLIFRSEIHLNERSFESAVRTLVRQIIKTTADLRRARS
jgi:hypothetical protein